MGTKTGVYVHIPFCVSKCAYCDFLSFTENSKELIEAYIRALLSEITHSERLKGLKLESVFFGGGTPSILSASELTKILKEIARKAEISTAEITLEANPAGYSIGLDTAKFKELKNAGFNRISIGLQAAQDQLLAAIGRAHTNDDFLRTYEAVVSAGFENINTDIMYALPGQTKGDLAHTLHQVKSLKIPHISAYSLTIEETTPFGQLIRDGMLDLPGEDAQRDFSDQVLHSLTDAGYTWYEISNFARQGYECRHNKLYWTRQNYIGFGLGAHSFISNTRWHNTCAMDVYVAAKGKSANIVHHTKDLSLTEQMEEFIFLGLRMIDGVSVDDFKQHFGESIFSRYGKQICKYESLGLLELYLNRLRLTSCGINVSNAIMADFIYD